MPCPPWEGFLGADNNDGWGPECCGKDFQIDWIQAGPSFFLCNGHHKRRVGAEGPESRGSHPTSYSVTGVTGKNPSRLRARIFGAPASI